MTSFCPTITLESSVSSWVRPVNKRSTVSRSSCGAMAGEGTDGISVDVFIGSMGHYVKDDVNSQRVSAAFRKRLKILDFLSFAFPAIPVIRIVDGDDHDALLVVHPRPN